MHNKIEWEWNSWKIHSKIMCCNDSSIPAVYVINPTNNAGKKSLKNFFFLCFSYKYKILFTTIKVQVEENY